MTGARVFAIVGPSGAGKDTLMQAAAARRADLVLIRRVITRPEAAGGEAFEGVGRAEFARRKAAGAFALDWEAHGLSYGIPAAAISGLAAGQRALFNGSRHALGRAAMVFPDLTVLNVTAPDAVLADRLAARGRESRDDVLRRLARARPAFPPGLRVIEIDNGGPLEDAVARFLEAIDGHGPA